MGVLNRGVLSSSICEQGKKSKTKDKNNWKCSTNLAFNLLYFIILIVSLAVTMGERVFCFHRNLRKKGIKKEGWVKGETEEDYRVCLFFKYFTFL